MERKTFDNGEGGEALLKAVDEANALDWSSQELTDATLTASDWRRYHEGLERLREAIAAVDETGNERLRDAA